MISRRRAVRPHCDSGSSGEGGDSSEADGDSSGLSSSGRTPVGCIGIVQCSPVALRAPPMSSLPPPPPCGLQCGCWCSTPTTATSPCTQPTTPAVPALGGASTLVRRTGKCSHRKLVRAAGRLPGRLQCTCVCVHAPSPSPAPGGLCDAPASPCTLLFLSKPATATCSSTSSEHQYASDVRRRLDEHMAVGAVADLLPASIDLTAHVCCGHAQYTAW